jgi:hypothetical protein
MPSPSYETRLAIIERDQSSSVLSVVDLKNLIKEQNDRNNQIIEKIYTRMEDAREDSKRDLHIFKKEIYDILDDQNTTLEEIRSKIEEFDRLRWIVLGAAAIIGFILSKVTGFWGLLTGLH